jgi:hypothetical protein
MNNINSSSCGSIFGFYNAFLLCVILGMAIRVSNSFTDSFMHCLTAGRRRRREK